MAFLDDHLAKDRYGEGGVLLSLKRVGVSMSNLRAEDVADEVAFVERA